MNRKRKIDLTITAFIVMSIITLITCHAVSLNLHTKNNSQSPNLTVKNKDFKNFIFTLGYNSKLPYQFFTNYIHEIKNELNFTNAHYYGNEDNYDGYYGDFGKLLSNGQIERINTLYDSVELNNLPVLSGRINIENVIYAQRIVYEAEGNGDKNYNYGFSYQKNSGKIITDGANSVVYASGESGTKPGYILENIYENLQHGDMFDFVQEDEGNWYIKPRMKIKTGENENARVVKINAVNFKGDTINSFIISVKDFGKNYNGNYIERYINDFIVSGKYDTKTGLNYGINDYNENDSKVWAEKCNIDFKVWWYGEVDVWIDKVIIDDNRGNNLFNGQYDEIIKQEAEVFGKRKGNLAFYSDEVVYSNIDCMQKVDEIINSVKGISGPSIHTATSNYHNTRGLKNDNLGYNALFTKVKLKSFSNDAHEIPWELPYALKNLSTLPNAKFVSNDEYNKILQQRFGDKNSSTRDVRGGLIYQIDLARKDRNKYSPQTEFIMQPQMHGWLFEDRDGLGAHVWGLREPTNEEIEAQAMISIAHGADGLCWFLLQYKQGKEYSTASGRRFWGGFGLLDSASNGIFKPRIKNFYGQNKYDYFGRLNSKIVKWKSVLDSADFLEGYSIHSEGAKHSFIQDIKSLYRNPSTLKYLYEEDLIRYWELAFFTTERNEKYFLLVNRRCLPEVSPGIGDLRQANVKFNFDKLKHSNRWRVIDVSTGKSQSEIDLIQNEYMNLGEFLPGEGRLFKFEEY